MSGVKLGGRESDLTIPECGLAIMSDPNPFFECVAEGIEDMCRPSAQQCINSLPARIRPLR